MALIDYRDENVHSPEGWYDARHSSKHPWYPARVEIAGGRYRVEVCGEPDPGSWPAIPILDLMADVIADGRNAFAHPLLRIVIFGVKVPEAQYRWRLSMHQWAKVHAPRHPAANPGDPINLLASARFVGLQG